MLDTLQTFAQQNPTLSAIYSGGIVATLVMHSKTIIAYFKELILNIISFDIYNINDSINYVGVPPDDLSIFLKNQKPIFQKKYEITSDGKVGNGLGRQWFIIFGKIVFINRQIEALNRNLYLSTSIRVFFANKKKFLNKFQESISVASNVYENSIKILSAWESFVRRKRSINSVYTNNSSQYKILNDIKKFLVSKDFYHKHNIPYKRNYLLYGKPGTGKTSLILALASELNYNIRIIDLSSMTNLYDIMKAISTSPEKTIFVFEDIDAINHDITNRENDKDNLIICNSNSSEISLSTILNLLDGLYTKENMIAFFTTNHIEKLDPAFLRDGRMDYKLELADLDKNIVEDILYKKLNKKYNINIESINPATLQEIIVQRLLNNIDDNEMIKRIESAK